MKRMLAVILTFMLLATMLLAFAEESAASEKRGSSRKVVGLTETR